MAHMLDESKGFHAFVSRGVPAWHGLGEVFPEGTDLTIETALYRGGLDFIVKKSPNIHALPIFDGAGILTGFDEIVSEDSFFTYRTDVNKVLGSKLGKDYEVFQNLECLNMVDEILQTGRAYIETAGAIDEGRKVFVCLKSKEGITVGNSDVVNQYVLICTSHDGSMSITATPTNVRVVCNNTLTAALRGAKGAIKIRHSKNAAVRLDEATKVLGLIHHNTGVNTDNYNTMLEAKISSTQMWDYFGNVFYSKEEIAKLQAGKDAKDVLSTQKQNVMNEVVRFASRGVGQAEAMPGNELNMWGAYNAVTGYLTRKKFDSANDRANNMLFGTGAARIQSAGVLALEPAKIEVCRKVSALPGFGFSNN